MKKSFWKIVKNGCGTVLCLVLVACMLAGCGSKQGDFKENSQDTVEDKGIEASAALGNKGNEESTAAEKNGTEESAAAETEGTASEQEVYVLTFEAVDTEGNEVTSDIFADTKLTMINVWATYCNPCLSEMPDLGVIATQYDKADFQMVGIISDVMEDGEESDISYAKDLIAETEATTYPHLLLNESLYVNLVGAVDAVPTTFFVNQKGELLGYVMGAQTKEIWVGLIDQLLAEME